MPAQLTRMSSRPKRSTTRSIDRASLCAVGQVGLEEGHFAAAGLDAASEFVAVGREVDHGQLGAGRRQALAHRQPQPAAAAGHQRHAAGNVK